jgi:hypothetical protein
MKDFPGAIRLLGRNGISCNGAGAAFRPITDDRVDRHRTGACGLFNNVRFTKWQVVI